MVMTVLEAHVPADRLTDVHAVFRGVEMFEEVGSAPVLSVYEVIVHSCR